MRRYFFRPTIGKLVFTFAMTFATILFRTSQSVLPVDPERSQPFVRIGASIAYLALSPTNPIPKYIVISLFWAIISWIVYFIVYFFEVLYVRIYNAILERKSRAAS